MTGTKQTVLADVNPKTNPHLFCEECRWTLEHMDECDIPINGVWENGHVLRYTRRSRKYPTNRDLYYLCGKRSHQ